MLATLLLSVFALNAPVPSENKAPADWPAVMKNRDFRFDADTSGVENCATAARNLGATVDLPPGADAGRNLDLTVSIKDGKPVQVLAHSGSAFAILADRLFFADFSGWSNGCKVIAYDLKTGKKIWTQQLEGIGAISHTKYRNRVALVIEKHPTADARGVVISGWESSGRYHEVLDPATGKMLANRKYDPK